MNRKLIVSIGILLLIIFCIFFLSNQAVLLSILLILISYAKHKMYPIQKEALWFILLCIAGTFAEILLVYFGNVWSYSTSNYLGIPIWIPFFWGSLGTTIPVLYEGFINRKM